MTTTRIYTRLPDTTLPPLPRSVSVTSRNIYPFRPARNEKGYDRTLSFANERLGHIPKRRCPANWTPPPYRRCMQRLYTPSDDACLHHSAHAAWHRGRLLLGLGHNDLCGDDEAANRGRVLQRGAGDHRRVYDAGRDEDLVPATQGVEAYGV